MDRHPKPLRLIGRLLMGCSQVTDRRIDPVMEIRHVKVRGLAKATGNVMVTDHERAVRRARGTGLAKARDNVMVTGRERVVNGEIVIGHVKATGLPKGIDDATAIGRARGSLRVKPTVRVTTKQGVRVTDVHLLK